MSVRAMAEKCHVELVGSTFTLLMEYGVKEVSGEGMIRRHSSDRVAALRVPGNENRFSKCPRLLVT